ncbi:MAG: hypothetical protein ACXV7J_06110 [Methylomonas sp.]
MKWPLALIFGLHAVLGQSAERLGGISDETAPPVAQPEPPATENDRRIIYRVICSPEGEQLPECAQPPVNDTFKTEPPRRAEPENAETSAGSETADQPLEQTDQEEQAAAVAGPKTHRNSVKHKKRSKNSVKKSAKTSKPAKKRKRHQS